MRSEQRREEYLRKAGTFLGPGPLFPIKNTVCEPSFLQASVHPMDGGASNASVTHVRRQEESRLVLCPFLLLLNRAVQTLF